LAMSVGWLCPIMDMLLIYCTNAQVAIDYQGTSFMISA
jgi:hypothetical protein